MTALITGSLHWLRNKNLSLWESAKFTPCFLRTLYKCTFRRVLLIHVLSWSNICIKLFQRTNFTGNYGDFECRVSQPTFTPLQLLPPNFIRFLHWTRRPQIWRKKREFRLNWKDSHASFGPKAFWTQLGLDSQVAVLDSLSDLYWVLLKFDLKAGENEVLTVLSPISDPLYIPFAWYKLF